jgi:hypothetical protein
VSGGVVEVTIDGLEVLQRMKDLDDEWFGVRNDAYDVGGRLADPQKRLEKFWRGPAYDKYCSKVGPQVTAARRVGELAEIMAKSLQTMASAGNTFYYCLLATLIAIVIGIMGLILALTGIFAIPGAVAGIAAALTATGAFLYGFFQLIDAQMAEKAKLTAEVGNSTGFDPGPKWPQAAALSRNVNPHSDKDGVDKDGEADWTPVNR